MWSFKLFSLGLVLLLTVIAGLYPFVKKRQSQKNHDFPLAESLAVGVFLGAGLIHMLGDASQDFYQLGYQYPIAFLLSGATFLFFLLFEHIGRELYHHKGHHNSFAIVAVIMLSVHSFLAGTALGITDTLSMTTIILLAILAHKWAASFALSVQINKSDFSLGMGTLLFGFFALMAPLGILFGTSAHEYLGHYPLIEPIFASLASGTFIYLGTLHGLERATLIKQCCNLKGFTLVILGFAIMAVVAIWT